MTEVFDELDAEDLESGLLPTFAELEALPDILGDYRDLETEFTTYDD